MDQDGLADEYRIYELLLYVVEYWKLWFLFGGLMQSKNHWDKIYRKKAPTEVSWFQEHAKLSLVLIKNAQISREAAIIDVGGGASTLVDDLLANGYRNITVLDISGAALAAAKARLGHLAANVHWREANILV